MQGRTKRKKLRQMRVPWWAKIGFKVTSSTLRVPYGLRARLGVGRHGPMSDGDYAATVVKHHLAAMGNLPESFTALELGPGDSTLSALVASCLGASRVILVDHGAYARYDPSAVDKLAALLRSEGLNPPFSSAPPRHEAFLEATSATYLTDGIDSLQSLAPQSVDALWSHAVLEHVLAHEVDDLLREFRRVLRPDGRASHRVDFLDHLSEGFNNLRFPSRAWERPIIWRSGAYTNRISPEDLIDRMERSGFEVAVAATRHRDLPPDVRNRLAPEFRDRPEEALSVAGFDLLAVPERRTRLDQ